MKNTSLKIVRGDIIRVSEGENESLGCVTDKIERKGKVVGYLCVPIHAFPMDKDGMSLEELRTLIPRDKKFSSRLDTLPQKLAAKDTVYRYEHALQEVYLDKAQVTSLAHGGQQLQQEADDIARASMEPVAKVATRRTATRHHSAVTTMVPDISIQDANALNYFLHFDTAYLLKGAGIERLREAYELASAKDQKPFRAAYKSLSVQFATLDEFRTDIVEAFAAFNTQYRDQHEDFPSDVQVNYPVLRQG